MNRALLAIVFFSVISFAYGQKLPDKAIGMPGNFDKPFVGLEDEIPAESYERYWRVYSDRNNNTTYTTPGGETVKNNIGFMQRFHVAEKQGPYLHLYKEHVGTSFPGISLNAESFGWIHKDNLLLWEHCIVNSQTHIDKKAMILNTFDGISVSVVEDQFVEYKNDPQLVTSSGRKSRMFEILFVYKILDDVVLLGQDVGIYGTEQDVLGLIRGWVPISNVTFWNHRITLEPNWEEPAFREREKKNIIPSIFSDARAAMDYKSGMEVKSEYVIWNNEPGPERNIGTWRRFPILPSNSTEHYKAGVMGKIRGLDSMTIERFAEISKDVEELEQKTRRINVVFVVDGTESMGKFFKPIADGIINSVNLLKSDDTQNRFRIGAVLYRDMAEGEHLVDMISLQDDHTEVISFLNKARTDYRNDKDAPEALYYGLKKAITTVGLSKEETNFIVLVGDAGNHKRDDETKLSEAEIVGLASEYDCSFICFQANNGRHETYDEFISQSQSLVLETAKKVHMENNLKKSKWRPDIYEQPYFISTGPNRYVLNDQEIMGSFLFPDKGSALPYSMLQNEIERMITRFDNRTSSIIQEGKKVISGHELQASADQEEVFEFTEAVVGFLSKVKGLSNSEIELLKMRNYQFSMDGYTSRDINGLVHPVFKEVLFLSANEMAQVLANLQRLTSGYGSINQKRMQMQEVWLNLLKSQMGDLSEEEVLSMSVSEISEMTLGLPVQSSFIKNVKLKDITEPTVVSDRQFGNYMDYFTGKVNTLRSYLTEGYEQSFFSNGMRYYWIPVEEFP